MNKQTIKELGKITLTAHSSLLFKHDSHNIPPLGVKVGYYKTNEKQKFEEIGKIVDIIGPVKNPFVVVKLNKEINYDDELKEQNFYFSDDKKKKKHFDKKRNRKKRL